jgi:hypothetical protein
VRFGCESGPKMGREDGNDNNGTCLALEGCGCGAYMRRWWVGRVGWFILAQCRGMFSEFVELR